MKRGNVISIASFPSNEPAPPKKLVARGTSGTNKITYIGDLTDGAGDTDGDGLTDWEEVRLYGTVPREPDTDCDGLPDGAEVGGGTDPLNPDSNGDWVPDGFTAETYAAHPLRGSETNFNFAVRLDTTCPDDARGVMTICGFTAFLNPTNTVYLNLPAEVRHEMSVAALGQSPLSVELFFNLVPFAMFHAHEVHCCCNELDYGVRIESVSSGLRLWSGRNQVAAGDTCGPSVSVEGVATNDSAYVRYSVLNGDGETIRTITRHFRVAVEATITLDAMTCGGGALVVKRPTDPARFNSATGTVCVTGAAVSCLMLEGDKVCFEQSGASRQTVNCDETGTQFVFYGVTPSETMNDASITLKTIGGETLVSTNLTVLWVDISMRCGQGDSLSPDNDQQVVFGRNDILGCQIVTNSYFVNGFSYEYFAGVIGNVVELKGRVYPADFSNAVTLVRDNIDSYIKYQSPGCIPLVERELNITRGQNGFGEGSGNDPTDPHNQDSDPNPSGNVYDVDTPGIPYGIDSGVNNPAGTIIAYINNFLQYAVYNGIRCSDDYGWFSRTMIEKTNSPPANPVYIFHSTGSNFDNVAGPGQTTIP